MPPRHTRNISRLLVLIASLVTAAGPGTAQARTRPTTVVRYDGPVSAYLVRITGTTVCSGSLIAPNRVITAAHCVLDPRTQRPKTGMEVEAGGKRYRPVFAIYDKGFASEYTSSARIKDPTKDVAVLTFTEQLHGPVLVLGYGPPVRGEVWALGYQSTWEDGTLVRPVKLGDTSHLKPGVNKFTQRRAACTIPVGSLALGNGKVSGPCGMIPGGSGGPLVSVNGTTGYLHGILSTVNTELTTNTWADTVSLMRIARQDPGVAVVKIDGPLVGGSPLPLLSP